MRPSEKSKDDFRCRQCCGSGSESGSTCFWASWIRIRINQSEIWIRIRILLTSFWLFIFKNDVHVPSKSNKQNPFFLNKFFVGILGRSMTKMAGSGSGSISQRHGSVDPDPPQNVMDPQHWLPTSADLKGRILDVRLFVLWHSLFLLVLLILLWTPKKVLNQVFYRVAGWFPAEVRIQNRKAPQIKSYFKTFLPISGFFLWNFLVIPHHYWTIVRSCKVFIPITVAYRAFP